MLQLGEEVNKIECKMGRRASQEAAKQDVVGNFSRVFYNLNIIMTMPNDIDSKLIQIFQNIGQTGDKVATIARMHTHIFVHIADKKVDRLQTCTA